MARKRKRRRKGRGFTRRPFGTLQRVVFKGLAGMDNAQVKSTLNLFAIATALGTGLVVGILAAVLGGDALGLSVFWRIAVGLVVGAITTGVVATWLEDAAFIRR